MAESITHLNTTGMHCPSCSMLVDVTLDDLDGVIQSKTDHVSGETVVTYDADAVSVDAMIEAIRGVGYDAEVAS